MGFQREIFSQRLKQLRSDKEMTMPALAEKISKTKQTIDVLEKDKANPSVDVLYALADALECSIDYLVGRSDEPKVRKPRKP